MGVGEWVVVIVLVGFCEGCVFKYCFKILLNMFIVLVKFLEIDILKKL